MKRQNSIPVLAAESGMSVVTESIAPNMFKTVITVGEFTQAVTAAALAFGKKLATFPKGVLHIHGGFMKVTVTSSADNDAQDMAMDVGAGTVVASGAAAVIGGTATFEDIFNGATTPNLTGATAKTFYLGYRGENDLKDGSSTAKAIFLNMAATFDAIETLTISGEVTVIWSLF